MRQNVKLAAQNYSIYRLETDHTLFSKKSFSYIQFYVFFAGQFSCKLPVVAFSRFAIHFKKNIFIEIFFFFFFEILSPTQ